jgi:hypothetical protein
VDSLQTPIGLSQDFHRTFTGPVGQCNIQRKTSHTMLKATQCLKEKENATALADTNEHVEC